MFLGNFTGGSQDSAFIPAWWLNSGHLQSIYPSICRRPQPLKLRRERLHTPDGDFLDVDFHGEGQAPLVILLHGLTGSSSSAYVRGLQSALSIRGFNSAALNFRGCSGAMNNTSRCYHSGETGDIDFLFRTLRRRHPDLPMAVAGFSMGGNVLLKWLGEFGVELDLFAAVAVSSPLRLDICASRLDQGCSRLYRNIMLEELKTYIKDKHRHLLYIGNQEEAEKIKALGDLSSIRSFWQYDNTVIAGLYDFADAAEYYRLSSSRQFLKHIRSPTLLIQAIDDPFMTAEVLPEANELSQFVVLEVCRGGGHVGFVSGNQPLRPEYWLDKRIPDFLMEHLP